jgi:hypothetical protein
MKHEFKKDDYYNLLINYIVKINKLKNDYKKELSYYLLIQGYFFKKWIMEEKKEIKKNIKENIKNKFIISEYKKIKNEEEIKKYREIKCPDQEEIIIINKKERKNLENKIKINLYEMTFQDINIKEKKDNEIVKIVNNLYNSKFYFIVRKECKDITKDNIFIINKLIINSKNNKEEYINKDYLKYECDTNEQLMNMKIENIMKIIFKNNKYDYYN